MRVVLGSFAMLGLALLLIAGVDAGGDKKDTKKEVTVKGKICCAKCELNEATECATVIVTKRDKKDITIYFDAKGHGKFHDDICSAAKNGSVTGALKKDGKKEVITVKDVKYE